MRVHHQQMNSKPRCGIAIMWHLVIYIRGINDIMLKDIDFCALYIQIPLLKTIVTEIL